MQCDEISQDQLQYMAEKIRRATAAKLSIVVCLGESDQEEGAEAVQCAIAGRSRSGDRRQQDVEVMVAVLRAADQLLLKMTGGTMNLQIACEGGVMGLGETNLTSFEQS